MEVPLRRREVRPPTQPRMTRSATFSTSFFRALRKNIVAQIALAILLLITVVGITAPWITPYNPGAQDLFNRLRAPSWLPGGIPGHILGTDDLGRDVLSRIILGAQVSLLVGLAATVVSGILGTVVGVISGYFRGWLDAILMRLADIQLAFPTILLALVLVAVARPSLWIVIAVLGFHGWMSYARVIRSEVLHLRERDFVTASHAIGTSNVRVMLRHIRPNIMAPLATIGTLQIASMIVAEASLSFLGLGVPPTIPTWGGMLAEGQLYVATSWWIALFSGVALVLTTLSINITGDLMRDVADPKAYR